MTKRKLMLCGAAAAALLVAGGVAATEAPQPRVIKIAVKKFEYIPPTVELKKGEAVVLELSSLDRLHGFIVQELKLHADVPPNRTVRVAVTPDKAGRYEFACDIFCGTGHEGLRGTLIVTE